MTLACTLGTSLKTDIRDVFFAYYKTQILKDPGVVEIDFLNYRISV
jgi:hypothetical protein